MNTASQMHSQDKAVNDNTGLGAHFGTYWINGGHGFTYRLALYGTKQGGGAENIGAGRNSPVDYVWKLNMDGHRGANFNKEYTHLGCGYYTGF